MVTCSFTADFMWKKIRGDTEVNILLLMLILEKRRNDADLLV